ncbi:hypothetical protein [Hymenobacter cavernae]|uniref:DUF2746 domain-containing protein n=1 Tax=Hymenobacter cavernae TaxID=2044852 RepID=A0ABQ1UVT1_9BACT|nr:hypothetical protein [Hymenobacter cavernae]GGF26337.1 hypothetical protein GCM10011383_42330 [Hymenobacter cavernae]
MILNTLLLQTQVDTGWDWNKIIPTAVGGLLVAIIMLLINNYRDGRNQYNNRIKALETKAVEHDYRLGQIVLDRENLVDKLETRFVSVEKKLATVDNLTIEVNRLTTEISHQSKAIEKLENKLDRIIEGLRVSK